MIYYFAYRFHYIQELIRTQLSFSVADISMHCWYKRRTTNRETMYIFIIFVFSLLAASCHLISLLPPFSHFLSFFSYCLFKTRISIKLPPPHYLSFHTLLKSLSSFHLPPFSLFFFFPSFLLSLLSLKVHYVLVSKFSFSNWNFFLWKCLINKQLSHLNVLV